MKNPGRARSASKATTVSLVNSDAGPDAGSEIIRDSELLLELIEVTEDAVIVCDESRQILYANAGAERMFGHPTSAMIGHSIDRLVPEDLVLAHQQHVRAFAAAPDTSRSMRRRPRIRGRRADGSTFPAEVTISKFRRGDAWFLAAVVRDVSERQREEERFRAILEGTARATGRDFFTSLVGALGRTLGVRYVLAAETIEGQEPTRLRTLAVWENGESREPFEYEVGPGSPCAQVMHMGSLAMAALTNAPQLSFAGHLTFVPQAYLAVRLDSSAGHPIGLLVAVGDAPVGPPQLPAQLLAIFAARASAEIERLRMEQALQRTEHSLRHAQKMEALGHFASGIAHDFNNILTIVTCAVATTRDMLPAERTDLRDELEHARLAARHGAQLVRKLMSFSRRGPVEQSAVDVGTVVHETSSLLRRVIPRAIEMHIDCPDAPTRARADTAALQQSLINLAMNAADAMADGGQLTFAVDTVALDATSAARLELDPAQRYVTVSVRDTGTGMTSETLARAFEPFYTTKEPGRGTGLGLSMVFGLVHQVGGSTEIVSAPGEGTCVTLYLEALPNAGDKTSGKTEADDDVQRGGSEHVLVVDDEWAVRRVLGRLLEERGYRVSFAADGMEALDILQREGRRIALVVSDFQMPRLDGARLYVAARTQFSHLRFVLMTGNDEQPLREAVGAESARVRLMRKPLEPSEFLEVVRGVLDR